MAYIEVTRTGDINIWVRVAGLDTNYSRDDRKIEWKIGNTYDGVDNIPAYAESVEHVFSGLMPGTEYDIQAEIVWYDYIYNYAWVSYSGDSGDEDDISGTFSILYDDCIFNDSDGTYVLLGEKDVEWTEVDSEGDIVSVFGRESSTSGYIDDGGDVYYISDQYDGEIIDHLHGTSQTTVGANWSTRYVYEYVDTTINDNYKTFSITASTNNPAPVRPDYFAWTNTPVKGKPFALTAKEWNALCTNINNVRTYKNISKYSSFISATTDDTLTAAMYNRVVSAIQGISGAGSGLSTVSKGDKMTAAALNDLVSAINAVK